MSSGAYVNINVRDLMRRHMVRADMMLVDSAARALRAARGRTCDDLVDFLCPQGAVDAQTKFSMKALYTDVVAFHG